MGFVKFRSRESVIRHLQEETFFAEYRDKVIWKLILREQHPKRVDRVKIAVHMLVNGIPPDDVLGIFVTLWPDLDSYARNDIAWLLANRLIPKRYYGWDFRVRAVCYLEEYDCLSFNSEEEKSARYYLDRIKYF